MISVIIPTYNRAKTIKRSIDSVLKQTYQDFELIIVDDNSTDNTREVVKAIADKRIRFVKHDSNKGACAARNTGVQVALGDYIAFQDSDDEWMENKLDIQIGMLNSNKVDIIACAYYLYKNKKVHIVPSFTIENDNIYNMLIHGNFIGTPTILGKRECFLDEPFDISLPRFQDWDLMLRLSQTRKIYFINEPLMNAYIQENSISENHNKAIIALSIIMDRNRKALEMNEKAMKLMYKQLGFFNMKAENFKKNYYINALKIGGFNIKIFIRFIEFEVRKCKNKIL